MYSNEVRLAANFLAEKSISVSNRKLIEELWILKGKVIVYRWFFLQPLLSFVFPVKFHLVNKTVYMIKFLNYASWWYFTKHSVR